MGSQSIDKKMARLTIIGSDHRFRSMFNDHRSRSIGWKSDKIGIRERGSNKFATIYANYSTWFDDSNDREKERQGKRRNTLKSHSYFNSHTHRGQCRLLYSSSFRSCFILLKSKSSPAKRKEMKENKVRMQLV